MNKMQDLKNALENFLKETPKDKIIADIKEIQKKRINAQIKSITFDEYLKNFQINIIETENFIINFNQSVNLIFEEMINYKEEVIVPEFKDDQKLKFTESDISFSKVA